MADLELTRLVFLLDRSGSMQSIKSDVMVVSQRSSTSNAPPPANAQ